MTQNNFVLNLIEKLFRSNIYLFIFMRFLTGKFFSGFIYDRDFDILKILEKKNFFSKKKVILDIGANDGMSYNSIRKFLKFNKIISFEPIPELCKNLNKIKKKDKFFNFYNLALSNSRARKKFYIPYFKNYPLTQLSGISINGIKKRLKESLYVNDLFKKLSIEKTYVETQKLDKFQFNTNFIKMDLEGHEFECVQGSHQTIKKHKPILMIEYDPKICDKIFKVLKKMNYKKYIFNKSLKKIEPYNGQKILNVFFINNEQTKSLGL